MNLATVLGLRPLDRVQINSQRERQERDMWRQMHAQPLADLPYFYFQRVLPDGTIEVRSQNGGVWTVSPYEICDVLPGEPIIVRAMPRDRFVERLKIQPPAPPTDDDYQLALVRYVSKDRWNRVDQVFVEFLDAKLNNADKFASPIHADDKAMIEGAAVRTRMPVVTVRSVGAAYSADRGVDSAARLAAEMVQAFRGFSIVGDRHRAGVLRNSGIKPVSRGALNKMKSELNQNY